MMAHASRAPNALTSATYQTHRKPSPATAKFAAIQVEARVLFRGLVPRSVGEFKEQGSSTGISTIRAPY